MRRFDVFERDSFTCVYCGYSSIEDGAELEADHIVPVALGGKNVAGNMATACWRCNQEKRVRKLAEVERVLNCVDKANLGADIDGGEQYFPSRRPKREQITDEQKRRNKMLGRSIRYYREMGWYPKGH